MKDPQNLINFTDIDPKRNTKCLTQFSSEISRRNRSEFNIKSRTRSESSRWCKSFGLLAFYVSLMDDSKAGLTICVILYEKLLKASKWVNLKFSFSFRARKSIKVFLLSLGTSREVCVAKATGVRHQLVFPRHPLIIF